MIPHLLLPLVLFVLSLAVATQNVHAQSPSSDRMMAWLQEEQRNIEQRLAGYNQRENQIQDHIRRAQEVQARAAQNDDSTAQAVARQAVDTANQALNNLRATRDLDKKNLSVINKAIAVYQECAQLRIKAEKDREALRRQLGASELTGEGSSSQPTLIAARTGMAAAQFAILANQFNETNRLILEATQNAQFITRNMGESTAVTVLDAENAWHNLGAMRAADECKDQMNKTFTHSHLTEKAIALGKCADFTAKMAEFLQLHGKLLEQAGKILGIAVPAVEFAHEVGQLHEDMKSLATYTRSNPESALKAAKILDERQRATLQRLSACQVRFADVFKGLH